MEWPFSTRRWKTWWFRTSKASSPHFISLPQQLCQEEKVGFTLPSHRGGHRSSRSRFEPTPLASDPWALGKPHTMSECVHTQAGEGGVLPHCKVGSETEPLGAGTVEAHRSLPRGGQLEVCPVFIFLNSGSATYPLCDPSKPLHLLCLRDLSGHLERTPILLTPRLGGDWMSWWGTEVYHPVDMLVAHPATTPQFLPYSTAILLILSAPRFRSQLI